MKYVIMCAGKGERWNNYLGIPKHLIEINGEPLLGRTTRLLKENGITDYIITGTDKRYKKYGKLVPQTKTDCEIDRYEEQNEPVCYLYGDVYYTKQAMKTIIATDTKNILFFGSECEIFAIKIENLKLFYDHKHKVKELYSKGQIDRCIGWEIYRSLNNIPFEDDYITDKYIKILDGTDDIDFPEDYNKFKAKWEVKNMKNYKVKATIKFNDTVEKTEYGTDTPRNIGDIFNCTKERYEELKKHNAVTLVGIEEIKEEVKQVVPAEDVSHETKEEKPKKKATKSKKKIDTVE